MSRDEGSHGPSQAKCPVPYHLPSQEEKIKNIQENKKDKRIKTGEWIGYRKRNKEKEFFVCQNCTKIFQRKRKSKKFCSTKCRKIKWQEFNSLTELEKNALEFIRSKMTYIFYCECQYEDKNSFPFCKRCGTSGVSQNIKI